LKIPSPVTVDFETIGIKARPFYPPAPVGVSIKYKGKKSKYYAWGHVTGNNCSWGEAEAALKKAWAHKDGVLFQNGKFDIDVAEVHMGMPELLWDKIEDTMFLLFLDDPHQMELGLKPSANRLLGLPAEEQDAVGEWLVVNQPIPGIKISKSKQSDHYFGKYIAFAPGDLVGTYAEGDTDRTSGLFQLLYEKTCDRGMKEAYDRERELMPILLGMEREGVHVSHDKLAKDVKLYSKWMETIEAWIHKQLKSDGSINLDSGAQLVDAMVAVGKADTNLLPTTPTGKYQTNKEALLLGVTDKVLLAVLKYRTQLKTCLGTFMKPWLYTADMSGGMIYTTWNQVKGDVGTRSGRLSSTPNFQNIPNEFKPIFAHEQKGLAKCPFKDLPPLPKMRGYISAPKGEILCGRDFSSQELRVLAHMVGGGLAEAYLENPNIDLHQYAADLITKMTGRVITRKETKNIAFSILYGSGLGKLAESLGCSVEEAKKFRDAYLGTFPGIKILQSDLKARAKAKLPITTYGGREYYCEEPKLVDGRLRHFDYKLTNYLIQGSSADLTKDAVIRFSKAKGSSRMLLSVHDEILISSPIKDAKTEMSILKECMNNCGLEVPMMSDGETGFNWAEMKECD